MMLVMVTGRINTAGTWLADHLYVGKGWADVFLWPKGISWKREFSKNN